MKVLLPELRDGSSEASEPPEEDEEEDEVELLSELLRGWACTFSCYRLVLERQVMECLKN
jgi:hypothetical protein